VSEALSLHVTGVVQGVGFRPFVYNLARSMGLSGWVRNASDGVWVHVEGEGDAVASFPRAVETQAPVMAVVQSVTVRETEPEGADGFRIVASEAEDGAMTLVSPDIATCGACIAELADPADRRFRYPFINCTNCGPRFTIIDDVPYDRPLTTMRDFAMCPECAAEYGDPSDRRFHAQPDACPVCGPRLYLNVTGTTASTPLPEDAGWSPMVETSPRPHRDPAAERVRTEAILGAAERLLLDGHILAIKGLGGFHLACDATNETAVARLRERKRRWGKPLAVMFPDLTSIAGTCELGREEESLLSGPVRPIVLLRLLEHGAPGAEAPLRASSALRPSPSVSTCAPNRPSESSAPGARIAPGAIAPSVAPGLREIGAVLPYTPLHHVLLTDLGRPLVMTSGNLSDEPIAMENAEALVRLADIADAFLLHDRGIRSRYDDSVVRVVAGSVEPVRRARGYAPFPLALPFETDIDILGAGPEQKHTFALLKGGHAFVSQHIGDLEDAETLAHFERTLLLYERLFRVQPALVAHDLHPEYLSTKLARTLGLPLVGVQHHHAHIVSVTAEHGVSDLVVGVAFDGTGYGTDGHIWGGEVLLSRWDSFERFAHLAEVPLVGGAAAVRRPARMAIGLLAGLGEGLLDHPGADALRSRLAENEEATLLRMIERGVNSPPTSSMGRLFDAVAALAGVRDDALYEGQAAIELEALADTSAEGAYRFGLEGDGPVVIDPRPVVSALLDDMAHGVLPSTVSARFHRAVAEVIIRVAGLAAEHADVRHVALAGGVFMNRLVLGDALRGVAESGLVPLTHVRLPANDGGISFGQAVAAWAGRHTVR